MGVVFGAAHEKNTIKINIIVSRGGKNPYNTKVSSRRTMMEESQAGEDIRLPPRPVPSQRLLRLVFRLVPIPVAAAAPKESVGEIDGNDEAKGDLPEG